MSLDVQEIFADGKEAEELCLQLAAVEVAFGEGRYQEVWQCAWAMEPYLGETGRWQDLISTQQLALAAALRLDDWLLQGHSHLALGRASLAIGDDRRARQQLAEGACILRAVGGSPACTASRSAGLGVAQFGEERPDV